jgi:hypothetical protein
VAKECQRENDAAATNQERELLSSRRYHTPGPSYWDAVSPLNDDDASVVVFVFLLIVDGGWAD